MRSGARLTRLDMTRGKSMEIGRGWLGRRRLGGRPWSECSSVFRTCLSPHQIWLLMSLRIKVFEFKFEKLDLDSDNGTRLRTRPPRVWLLSIINNSTTSSITIGEIFLLVDKHITMSQPTQLSPDGSLIGCPKLQRISLTITTAQSVLGSLTVSRFKESDEGISPDLVLTMTIHCLVFSSSHALRVLLLCKWLKIYLARCTSPLSLHVFGMAWIDWSRFACNVCNPPRR
jgi:hypothetical protein